MNDDVRRQELFDRIEIVPSHGVAESRLRVERGPNPGITGHGKTSWPDYHKIAQATGCPDFDLRHIGSRWQRMSAITPHDLQSKRIDVFDASGVDGNAPINVSRSDYRRPTCGAEVPHEPEGLPCIS
jgi:hypothetical protein